MTIAHPQSPEIQGYRHVRLISDAGGFGDIHLYTDISLGREVAVKVIRETDLSPVAVQRLMAEASAMAVLEHPHIVPVYGAGLTTDGRPYLAMQYCPKATLEDRASRERLGIAEVLRTGIGIGSAVETVHRAGLLHRDIKPANILTTRWGAPGLTDFGVAARMSSGKPAEDDVGVSPPWSPPEMLYTDSQGTPASDVYSLAATLWHLLVGRAPFAVPEGDNSRMATMSRVRDLPPPATGRSDVPPELDSLLIRAMAKDPARRPQTMAEFVSALQSVEAQLGLPRTEAVYVDGGAGVDRSATTGPGAAGPGAPGPGAPVSGAEDGTRIRPGRAGATAGAPGSSAPAIDQQSTRLRAPRAGDQLPDSDGAGLGGTSIQLPLGPAPALPARSRRLLAWSAGALVLVSVAVAGWLMSGEDTTDRSGTGGPTASPVRRGPGPDSEDLIPPGPVTITASRAADTVTFTWEYSASLATDTYRWEVVGGAGGVATKPTVTVPAQSGGQVCLHVVVVRSDGSFATREWSPSVCG